jgi:MoaA/NifB/PqqE/SkfB family radical SAM enzyme
MDLNINTGKGLLKNWNSDTANSARESMLDGSFKYCSKTKCPHLSKVLYTDKPSGPIIRKTPGVVKELELQTTPDSLKIVFDDACNLACPSCRVDFIRNTDVIYNRSLNILSQMDEHYSKSLEFISLSGYGDPFYSTALFEWMCNLDPIKYPKLDNINIHTNGILWNQLNWSKLKKIHPYVKSAEISIDAATPETYKVVRRGGKWDLLLRNLEFISTIDSLKSIILSFVIQNENYREIVDFYRLVNSIFGENKNVYVSYYKILNWGVLSKHKFKVAAVWEPSHPNYQDLVNYVRELSSIDDNRILHNLYDII